MNPRVRLLIIGVLLPPLGCGGDDDPTDPAVPRVLEPSEFCSDHHPYAAIATFEDANLEAVIRAVLSVGGEEPLPCGLISGLTKLFAESSGITSLVGIQNLTNLRSLVVEYNSISDIGALSGLTGLTYLRLGYNSITDIGALSGLTGLTTLWLSFNSITDISPLGGLTGLRSLNLYNNSITDISALSGLMSLTTLNLSSNSISDISALSGLTSLVGLGLNNNPNLTDIQPLLDNSGLGADDHVNLESTSVSCTDVAALQAKGVTVQSDCP